MHLFSARTVRYTILMWFESDYLFLSGIVARVFFFFSSRRRHTRLVSDWSSDVCSSDLDSFTAALASGSIPSLDFVYADRSGRIANIYNGAFPERDPAHDWSQAVAGNVSATLWKTYFPFENVPKVVAPGSGFVISANATPFQATADPFNPKEEAFPPSMGIETRLSNRARRALPLLGADRSITADDFRPYKFAGC